MISRHRVFPLESALHWEEPDLNIYGTNLSSGKQGLGLHLLGGSGMSTALLRRCSRVITPLIIFDILRCWARDATA